MLLMTVTLLASAFSPTLLRLSVLVLKVVCREVRIILVFRYVHSKVWIGVSLKSLKVQSACLYKRYFSGVALWHISCNFTYKYSFEQYFRQVLIALADDANSFCFRFECNELICQISEL